MSIYARNTHINTGDYDVVATEGYAGDVGASRIIIESIQNDMSLFGALIGNDFAECALTESSDMSDVLAIAEAASVGFIDKIKEFMKKVWAKVKGLFNSFIARLKNVIIRDNKKFVEQYKNEVVKKDLSKMKYKSRKPKAGFETFINKVAQVDAGNQTRVGSFDSAMNKSEKEIQDAITEVNSSEHKAKAYGAMIGTGSVEPSEYRKEVIDYCMEDENESEGLSSQELLSIMDALVNSKKAIKDIEDANKNTDKYYTKRLGELDKARSAVAKLIPNGGTASVEGSDKNYDKVGAAKASKALSLVYDTVKLEQSIITTSCSIILDIVKMDVKQCRSIFARAAAYNPKATNESTLMDAVEDDSDHEMEIAFEGSYAY